jgi:hypothetical protein
MSNTELTRLLAEEPEEVRQEVLRINAEARPIALQVALLVPLLAGLADAANSLRMARLPDSPSLGAAGVALG